MSHIPTYSVVSTNKGVQYVLQESIRFYSDRYDKILLVPEGFVSDGATGAVDVNSASWWIHDMLCEDCTWDDGTPLTNWQASHILGDVLIEEGRWIRGRTWFWSTWMFGCKGCRKNGMW